MKVIFLDFDGVLNSESWFLRRADLYEMDDIRNQYPLYEIDPESVKILNRIIEETGAKVVVSSTWRHGRTAEKLQNILNHSGFVGEIVDVTPSLRMKDYDLPRGCEIDFWLNNSETPVEAYLILDDDSDMLLKQKNHFVKTSWKNGLFEEHFEKCTKILKIPTTFRGDIS